ncbi:hypothetical protein [Streptomyces celluloflavus]|uniref:Uncharacterized protein n=1 Tax=Streptomyces celluloflavus TaxID=58344 RepID=A0ABW7RI98_9ACTN|nr:hypothetical protein OG717_09465 [Streptomyces celluloflavus]
MAGRLAHLPTGWRAEVVRRTISGEGDLIANIANAQMSINILRSVWGIDVHDMGLPDD